MKTFCSSEKFNIKGRGLVYLIELEPQDSLKLGEVIVLDGEVRQIHGIDVPSGWYRRKSKEERKLGIVVKELESAS